MSEDKKRELAEILADFSTAIESACVSLKRNLNDLLNMDEPKPLWDASKIAWEKASGSKGEYEKANCVGNLDFENLVKDLQAHGGRLRREGMFYWLFEKTEQPTVGRKKVK
jgi:hypothetical protein